MKTMLVRVVNSRFSRIARLGALLCIILSILNSSIVLPQTIILAEAKADVTQKSICQTTDSTQSGYCGGGGVCCGASCMPMGTVCPSPEIPAMVAPVFMLLMGGVALGLRRRFVAGLAF